MRMSSTHAGCEWLLPSPRCLSSAMQHEALPGSLVACQDHGAAFRQAINAGGVYAGIPEYAAIQHLDQICQGGSSSSGFPRSQGLPSSGFIPLKSQGVSGLVPQHGQCPKQEPAITDALGKMTGVQDGVCKETNPGDQDLPADLSMPDITLFQDICFGCDLPGIGKVYLHMVADSSGFACGLLHTSDGPEAAVAALEKVILPDVSRIVTPRGPAFCGSITHPYERYLARNLVEHIYLVANHSSPSRSLVRFQRAVLNRFFGRALPQCRYESLEVLQEAFASWLDTYNEVNAAQRGWRLRRVDKNIF